MVEGQTTTGPGGGVSMDVAKAQEFLQTNHHVVLATFRKDGRPAMSPMAAGLDAEGRVIVSTRATAIKVQHLRRDPRIALNVLSDAFFGEWIQVEGMAEIIELPDAMEILVDYYRTVSGGEHDDWDEYRAAMEREQRVILRFAIERAGPNVSG
jgi:PPOX class probable F420-dependent enzyme